jgi:hypothetical protein
VKRVEKRSLADPEAAARKLVELAAAVEPVQDGRIHIEKINYPFIFQLRGSSAEFGAGIAFAIERGWLWQHESKSYFKLMPSGEDLLAQR